MFNFTGDRAAHSCDKVGNNLYIFGGWNGKQALNDLHILDIENLLWSQPEWEGNIPACRNNHTTAVVGESIYCHGGHDGNDWLDDLYIFNTTTYTWAKPKLSGNRPSGRACHTMSRVGRKLYMFGGYDGERCFNDMDVLDLDTMTWIQPWVAGQFPMARNAHTMTVVGTKLFLFGGHSGNKHLKDLHIFDTETLEWTEPTIYGNPPKGLRGHTASLIGNKLYLFGGYDGRGKSVKKIIPSNDLYVLNTDTMRWSHPSEIEKSPVGRQRHTACVIGTKQLLIFGGFDGWKWLNDIWVLDIGKMEVNEITHEATNALIENMRKIFNKDVFSDVIFEVEDKVIYAHKAILVSQCDHFKAMFTSGMKESTQTKIQIKDWTYSSYLHMIEYLYTGWIKDFNPTIGLEILGLADAYGLENLKSLWENTLIHNVDNDNVVALLIDGHSYSALELKKFCMNYMIKNFSEVQSTKGFEALENVPSLLMEITKNLATHSQM